jgi:hypothetical protein
MRKSVARCVAWWWPKSFVLFAMQFDEMKIRQT